jgi:hypothetical protein
MLSYWKPILGYCPRFSLLSNHWLVFHFLSESDLLRILDSPWIFGKGVLMLKIWHPGFNPLLENFKKRSLWMLLPDFPLDYWSIRVFEAIANSVGKFIYFDELALENIIKDYLGSWLNWIWTKAFRIQLISPSGMFTSYKQLTFGRSLSDAMPAGKRGILGQVVPLPWIALRASTPR